MSVEERRRSLVFPREHGAWGILLVPLITGSAAGLLQRGDAQGIVPLTVAVLALFWLRTPVESWMGMAPLRAHPGPEMRFVRTAALILAAVAVAALTVVFQGGRNRELTGIGAAAAAAFLLQAAAKRASRGARTLAQMIGAAGLTSVAPAAYYVVTGALDRTAWLLWGLNFLFAINQIQYVHLRISAARAPDGTAKLRLGRWFFAQQFGEATLLASCAALGLINWYAASAFAPVLLRGFAWFGAAPAALKLRSVGIAELMHACAFGVLLVLAFWLKPDG